MSRPKLIPKEEVAELLGFSPLTVKKKYKEWTLKYGLRHKKIGGSLRFYYPDVARMVEMDLVGRGV